MRVCAGLAVCVALVIVWHWLCYPPLTMTQVSSPIASGGLLASDRGMNGDRFDQLEKLVTSLAQKQAENLATLSSSIDGAISTLQASLEAMDDKHKKHWGELNALIDKLHRRLSQVENQNQFPTLGTALCSDGQRDTFVRSRSTIASLSALALSQCLLNQSKGRPLGKTCTLAWDQVLEASRKYRGSDVQWAVTRVLSGTKVWLSPREQIEIKGNGPMARIRNCHALSWAVKLVSQEEDAKNAFLTHNWFSSLLDRFPTFLVVHAAAGIISQVTYNVSAAKEFRARLSRFRVAALNWTTVFMAQMELEDRRLHQQALLGDSQRRDLPRVFVEKRLLPALLSVMQDARSWAQHEPEWLEAGDAEGIWEELHFVQQYIVHWSSCPGPSMWTHHTGYLSHLICFPSTTGPLSSATRELGYWPDADAIAYILLFFSMEFRLPPSEFHVMDIGANIGMISVLLAKLGFAVDAVEADPTNIPILRQNTWNLRLRTAIAPHLSRISVGVPGCSQKVGRIRIHGNAVSDRVENLTIEAAGAGASSAVDWQSKAHPAKRRSGGRFFRVQATLIDNLLPRFDSPTVLKLDIEGSEWRALLGARRILESVRVVILEIIPEWLEKSGCLSPAMLALALPGFAHAYQIFARFRPVKYSRMVALRNLPRSCLEQNTWLDWWRCDKFGYDDTQIRDFLFSKTILTVGEKFYAGLHKGQILRFIVAGPLASHTDT